MKKIANKFNLMLIVGGFCSSLWADIKFDPAHNLSKDVIHYDTCKIGSVDEPVDGSAFSYDAASFFDAESFRNIKNLKIPADMAYWIADIKMDDNKTTIVEFGDGNSAGYKVLDHMLSPGKAWGDVWEYLHKLRTPIWFVGSYQLDEQVVAWKKFNELGGYYAPSLEYLENRPDFLKQSKRFVPKELKSVQDYQGIIMLKRYKPTKEVLENFKNKFPNFLIVNALTTKQVGDKKLSDQMFVTPQMRAFRPRSLVLPKQYDDNLAARIIDQLNVDWYVVKPINAGRGNGIIMTKKENLQRTLKNVLVTFSNSLPIDDNYDIKIDPPLTYDYWKYDRNSKFLVEEYVPSKTIVFDNKEYDATMRVIFMMRYENGLVSLDFLDGYWKRPIKSLSDTGTFRDKHLSKHAPSFEESKGYEVSEQDYQKVQKSLSQILPQVYLNMLLSHYSA